MRGMAAITACWLPGCFSSQLAGGNSWDVRGPQGKKRPGKEADPRRSGAVGSELGSRYSVLVARPSATFFQLAGRAVLPRMPARLETPLIQNVIGTLERPCMEPAFRPSFVPLFLGRFREVWGSDKQSAWLEGGQVRGTFPEQEAAPQPAPQTSPTCRDFLRLSFVSLSGFISAPPEPRARQPRR